MNGRPPASVADDKNKKRFPHCFQCQQRLSSTARWPARFRGVFIYFNALIFSIVSTRKYGGDREQGATARTQLKSRLPVFCLARSADSLSNGRTRDFVCFSSDCFSSPFRSCGPACEGIQIPNSARPSTTHKNPHPRFSLLSRSESLLFIRAFFFSCTAS